MVMLTKDGRPARPATNGSAPSHSPTPAKLTFELVQEDPPESAKGRRKIEDQVRPLLEQLVAEADTAWYRVALYPAPTSAGPARCRLVKEFPAFEWRSGRVGATSSGIWARWMGPGESAS